jgi:polyvinyl alcohol dehydrogenase (cytochrome)
VGGSPIGRAVVLVRAVFGPWRRLAGAAAAGVTLMALVGTTARPPSLAAGTCGSWPLEGNDPAGTRSAAGGPTASQAATLQVKWRFHATDGDFTGTPVLANCQVLVGSNGGWVRALDEETGSVRWSTDLGAPIPSSLAVELSDDHVFAAAAQVGSPFVAALDDAGHVLWKTTISTQSEADAYGSPLFVPDVPVSSAGGTAGARAMVFEGVASDVTDEVSSSTDTTRGELVALDAATGDIVWTTYTVPPGDNGGAVWSTPAYDPTTDTLYVGTGNAYSGAAADTTDSVLAVDASTGVIEYHFQATSGDVFGTDNLTGPDYDFGASPNLVTYDGQPAVGIGQKSGTYWMLTPDPTGKRFVVDWSATTGRGSPFGGVVGSTAFGGGRVYGPNTLPGYLWALDEGTGQLAWIDPSLDPLHYGPATFSSGVVYTEDSDGFLDCVDSSNGLLVNRLALNSLTDLVSGSYAEAYGGVSVDSVTGLVFADTGSQSTSGDVVALAPGGLPGGLSDLLP